MENKDSGECLLNICRLGDVQQVKIMLDHGFDLNYESEEHGMNPLMISSMNGHIELVNFILKNGVEINKKTKDGLTALMLASSEGYKDVVETLLKNGVDVNIQNEEGGTALMLASLAGQTDVVRILLRHGVDADIKNKYGITARLFAQSKGYKEIVKILGEYGFASKSTNLYNDKEKQKTNTLVINNNKSWYNDITLYQDKIYSYSRSNDYMSQYSDIDQYKMNGFTVYERLLEHRTKNDGDMEYYDVKNGVVLEDNIIERCNNFSILKKPDEEIQRLKKECQRHELTFYKIKYFILSRHPEVISKQELREYLISELERIKSGISKTKELSNKYKFKLEFYSDHSFGLFENLKDVGDSYDLSFLNEKDKSIEQRNEFNNEFILLLKEVNCEKSEIERAEDIIETLNGYLDKDSFSS